MSRCAYCFQIAFCPWGDYRHDDAEVGNLQAGCEVRAHDPNIHDSEQKANNKCGLQGVRLLLAIATERIHTFGSTTLGPSRFIGIWSPSPATTVQQTLKILSAL